MNDMSWDYLYHIQAVENHCFHHCRTFVEQRYNLKYYSQRTTTVQYCSSYCQSGGSELF